MKIYFAHPKNMYGTEEEINDINLIRKNFENSEIINPAIYENIPKADINIMEFYYKLVFECDILIFKRLKDKITAGVGDEVNFALKKNKRVFEIKNNIFLSIKDPVIPISIEETRELLKLQT